MKKLGAIFCLLLAGCAVGPDYAQPDLSRDTDKAWHAKLPHEGKTVHLQQWWQQFNDPALDHLIAAAEKDSPTMQQALARITQARANLRGTSGAFYPAIGASGGVTRSLNNLAGIGANRSIYQTLTTGQFDAAWEVDLFGGLRRSREAAKAREQSALAGWHDARVSLAAEVANSYMNLRGCQEAVAIYAEQLTSQEKTRDLTRLKVDAGFLPEADGQRISASAAQTAAQLENQRGLCAQVINYLTNLTGLAQEKLQKELAMGSGEIPSPATSIILQLPAKTISQRPDVASAERNLAAASADIGVATAQLYPSLSLNGVIGFNSTSGLNNVGERWSYGPSISLPIFDGGQRKSIVERNRGLYDEALGSYRQTVRNAVNEVEDALVRLDTAAKRRSSAELAVKGFESAFHSGEESYRVGTTSLLDLEDLRRSVLAARITLVDVEQEWSQAWVALYKAAGGGWDGDFSQNPSTALSPSFPVRF